MDRPPEAADVRGRFAEDLVRVVSDPAVRRLAERRAGSRELAEDALQETFWAVSRLKDPEIINDLRAFFLRALINQIAHLRARSTAMPVEDISLISDKVRGELPSRYSFESHVNLRLLAEEWLTRLERDHYLPMESIPARSDDPNRYRMAIAKAAKKVLLLLLEGDVSSADWNMILKDEYPQWWDEPGLGRNTFDQRFSRGRSDVRHLLQMVAGGSLSQ